MIPQKKKKRILVRNRKCTYCDSGTVPSYKDTDVLGRLISERAKILGGDLSGVCSKHQRRVAVAIKRARHLAMLPFVSGV